MKTTNLLAVTIILVAVIGCSKKDNQEAINTPGNTPTSEKSMQVMPSETVVKPSPMLPNEIKANDTTTVIEQNDSGRKVIFWYDPMLPDRHFSKSGKSPFMDMKLAPQYEVATNKGGTP